jgi:hypothetical protein
MFSNRHGERSPTPPVYSLRGYEAIVVFDRALGPLGTLGP